MPLGGPLADVTVVGKPKGYRTGVGPYDPVIGHPAQLPATPFNTVG